MQPSDRHLVGRQILCDSTEPFPHVNCGQRLFPIYSTQPNIVLFVGTLPNRNVQFGYGEGWQLGRVSIGVGYKHDQRTHSLVGNSPDNSIHP